MLLTILGTLVIGICTLICISPLESTKLKQVALVYSIIVFYISLLLWILFDNSHPYFQYVVYFTWLPSFNSSVILGIDGMSLLFIILTTFLTPTCILVSWNTPTIYIKKLLILLILLELFLVLIFTSLDLLLFYVFFESSLIPMFLIIGSIGIRTRRIKAAYWFFLYTLCGSFVLLFGILLILFEIGSTNLYLLICYPFSFERQLMLWVAFFISFAIKIPTLPFHLWLPEAHVEAPTMGSVMLAGILLKLGLYGLLRFSIILFPQATIYYTPMVYAVSVISIVYSSLTALRQLDLKKILAYSSIAHMNFAMLGLFSTSIEGFLGSLVLMISHGFTASALFISIGILYDRYHTKLLPYYGGLATVMPTFSTLFMVFIFSNLGLPGTSSFVGELLIILGSFEVTKLATLFGSSGIVLSALYSLWLYNRVCFGTVKIHPTHVYIDASFREFYILSTLLACIVTVGLFPTIALSCLYYYSCSVYLFY